MLFEGAVTQRLIDLLEARAVAKQNLLLGLGAGSFLALLVTLYLVFTFLHSTMQRLDRLLSVMQAGSTGNLGERVDVAGADELAAIGVSSLGRAEPHVLENVNAVLRLLELASGQPPHKPPEFPLA